MNLPRLGYYVLFTLVMLTAATAWQWSDAIRFAQVPQLWWEPIAAGILTGWLSALLGAYLVLNRVAFLGLAVSQGAGLGIFLVFLIGGWLGWAVEPTLWPVLGGIVLATGTAGLFAWLRGRPHISEEAITGLLYVVAAGLTIMIGDRLSHGHHEIDDFLLGNAVAVLRRDLITIATVTITLSGIHFAAKKYFIYCSADEEFMRSRGIPTRRWLGLLFVTLTIGITFAVKTLGLLPVFALLLIPAFIGLKGARNMLDAFSVALFIGAVCPPLGYYFSFLFAFPTGATIIFVSGLYLLFSCLKFRPVFAQAVRER